MTDQAKFLETEAAVNALLGELAKIKSASAQLDQAGTALQTITGSSENLYRCTQEILDKNSSQLETIQNLSGKVGQSIDRFDQGRGDLVKQMQEITAKQSMHADLIQKVLEHSEQICQINEEHTASVKSLEQLAKQSASRTTVIIGITALNAVLAAVLLVLHFVGG